MKKSLFTFLLFLMFSCQLQEVETPEAVVPISSYHWVNSSISTINPIYFSHYDLNEDGNLYAYGYEVSDKGFYKLEGDKWRLVEKIKQGGLLSNAESFTFYNGAFYYSSFNKLYRLESGIMKEIFSNPNGNIYDLKSFNDKILIAGENMPLNGENYSLINFDSTQFQPISKHKIISRGVRLENKILFAGFPGLTYDGEAVTLNNVYGYIAGADNMDNVYVIDNEVNSYKVLQKRNSNTTQIGKPITLSDTQDALGGLNFTDNSFVVVGSNNLTHNNITFVLNKNTWEKVEMAESIIFISFIKYNGLIIGCTDKGELLELVKK